MFASHLWGNSRFNHFSAKIWNRKRRLHSNPYAVCVFTLISFQIETNQAISRPFPSCFETRFWRQCLQSNGAQTGYDLLSRDFWCILYENPCIQTNWFLLFSLENRVFCFLPFLSRLGDWPVLKSEKNRDDFIWWWKPSTIRCDFGGWNRSSVRPTLFDIPDKWSKFFQCRVKSDHEWSGEP